MPSDEMTSDVESFDEGEMYGLYYSMEAVSEWSKSSDGGEEVGNLGQAEIEMVYNFTVLNIYSFNNLEQDEGLREMFQSMQISAANISAIAAELFQTLDITESHHEVGIDEGENS
jgi:hypothetical protein